MRYFEISVQRVCGEFVCGRVSRAFYDYWQDRDEEISLETHMLHLDDEEYRDPKSPNVTGGEDDAAGWYEVDDIIHMNNAVTSGNIIHVEEVTPDEDSWTGYKYLPDGYSETFDFDDLGIPVPEGFYNYTREVEVETDIEVPENPVIVCKSIEKGLQTMVFAETDGPFDLAKLQFEIWYIDGDPVIASVSYDGAELENHPDSSDGRAFYAYLGDLVSNVDERTTAAPSDEALKHLDEAIAMMQQPPEQISKGRPFLWSMLLSALILLLIAAGAYAKAALTNS